MIPRCTVNPSCINELEKVKGKKVIFPKYYISMQLYYYTPFLLLICLHYLNPYGYYD